MFSVRIAAIALSVTAMALLLSTPFVDVLVIGGGVRWFAAFGVVIAIGLSAAAIAIAVTIVLFRLIGPSRTRLVAQILAAVIGAGFVIALQIAAILSYGTLSRFAVLTSDAAAASRPMLDSIVWWPARAALGDGEALLLSAGRRPRAARRRDGDLLAALRRHRRQRLGQRRAGRIAAPRAKPFRAGSRQQALRRKEFVLLRRDPWLVSQTLMQLLYLVPPALLLWRSFSDSSAAHRADHAGHRDGGGPARRRSRLADDLGRGRRRSGRDRAAAALARDPRQDRGGADRDRRHLRAAGAALAFASPLQAAVTALGVIIAAASATAIQLWFRVQARRSQFRRRQTSSRIATFAEAFSSIGWAATAALALAIPIAALDQRPDDRGHHRGDLEDQPAGE